VACGLSYLHHHRVIHYDLKSSNVLLSGGRAKISDVGMAKILPSTWEYIASGGGSFLSSFLDFFLPISSFFVVFRSFFLSCPIRPHASPSLQTIFASTALFLRLICDGVLPFASLNRDFLCIVACRWLHMDLGCPRDHLGSKVHLCSRHFQLWSSFVGAVRAGNASKGTNARAETSRRLP
jgi:serine/threonine protein kinase